MSSTTWEVPHSAVVMLSSPCRWAMGKRVSYQGSMRWGPQPHDGDWGVVLEYGEKQRDWNELGVFLACNSALLLPHVMEGKRNLALHEVLVRLIEHYTVLTRKAGGGPKYSRIFAASQAALWGWGSRQVHAVLYVKWERDYAVSTLRGVRATVSLAVWCQHPSYEVTKSNELRFKCRAKKWVHP